MQSDYVHVCTSYCTFLPSLINHMESWPDRSSNTLGPVSRLKFCWWVISCFPHLGLEDQVHWVRINYSYYFDSHEMNWELRGIHEFRPLTLIFFLLYIYIYIILRTSKYVNFARQFQLKEERSSSCMIVTERRKDQHILCVNEGCLYLQRKEN